MCKNKKASIEKRRNWLVMKFLFNPICKEDQKFQFPRKTWVLKLNGSWPLDHSTWNNMPWLCILYKIWGWLVIFNLIYTLTGESQFFIEHIGSISETTENLCTNIMGFLIVVRLVHMQFNQKTFHTLLHKFATNIWIPKNSNPHVEMICTNRLGIFEKMTFVELSTIIMYVTVPVAYIIATGMGLSSTEKPLPFKMIYPYDIQRDWVYITTYLLSGYAGFTVATQLFSQDAIFGQFISYTCGQFEILHQNIARLVPECHERCVHEFGSKFQEYVPLSIIQQIYVERLHELASHHNHLIEFCKILEYFNGIPLLVNFLMSTFVICMVVFQFVTGDMFFLEYVKFTVYFMALFGQIYIISANGNYLIEYSVATAWHLYACNWEGGHLSMNSELNTIPLDIIKMSIKHWKRIDYCPTGKDFQIKMQFMIMRSQNPLQLTALKFSVLSLESFSTLISTSMSYFTVLKTFVTE